MWIAISMAISLALAFLLPFPFDIIAIIAVFLSINYFIRQRQMRKMGLNAWSFFGSSAGPPKNQGVNYSCVCISKSGFGMLFGSCVTDSL